MKNITFGHETANEIAVKIIEILSPGCVKIDMAGSLRRGCETVHDIDIVAWPIMSEVRTGQPDLFSPVQSDRVLLPIALNAITDANGFGRIIQFNQTYKRILQFVPPACILGDNLPIQIELYFCEPDGSNYAALLQMRTGSAEFNIYLATIAQRQGLKYKAGYGVYRENERIDNGTEKGIFDALEIEYISPYRRGKSWIAY